MKPRFLLDEHINLSVKRGLLRLEPHIEVIRVGDQDAPALGAPDAEILEWIVLNSYILVSENRRTIPTHLQAHLAKGLAFPGILWIRPHIRLGQLVEELYLIWTASEAEEYVGVSAYIPF